MAADTPRSFAWDDLRLVHAVASTGTLVAAALQLGIDHSTVFRRLRQIEKAFGTPIFERSRTGYSPTPGGEAVVALAARVDEDITTVARQLAGRSAAPVGEIRLATSDALLSDLLLPLLAEFRAQHQQIRLDLVVGNVPANLSRRDADVAVRATDSPPDTLVGRRVGRIAWALYGSRESSVQLPDPDTAPWVGPGDNLGALASARYLRQNVERAREAVLFDTVAGIAAGVEAGMGIGHLPCFIGDRRPGLTRLAAPIPDFTTELWLLTHQDLRHVPRIRTLLDFLAARLAPLRPLIEGVKCPAGPAAEDASPGTAVAAGGSAAEPAP